MLRGVRFQQIEVGNAERLPERPAADKTAPARPPFLPLPANGLNGTTAPARRIFADSVAVP
jgi:hypothetical protein